MSGDTIAMVIVFGLWGVAATVGGWNIWRRYRHQRRVWEREEELHQAVLATLKRQEGREAGAMPTLPLSLPLPHSETRTRWWWW